MLFLLKLKPTDIQIYTSRRSTGNKHTHTLTTKLVFGKYFFVEIHKEIVS